jgi:hypothetical protein
MITALYVILEQVERPWTWGGSLTLTFGALGVALIGSYLPSGTASPPLDDPSTNSIGGSNDLKSCDGLYCEESSEVC